MEWYIFLWNQAIGEVIQTCIIFFTNDFKNKILLFEIAYVAFDDFFSFITKGYQWSNLYDSEILAHLNNMCSGVVLYTCSY